MVEIAGSRGIFFSFAQPPSILGAFPLRTTDGGGPPSLPVVVQESMSSCIPSCAPDRDQVFFEYRIHMFGSIDVNAL